MKKYRILFLLLLAGYNGFGQDTIADKYAESITTTDLSDYLSILASDALEGRETGSRGQKMAAAFIKNHFERIGLTSLPIDGSPDFIQKVPLKFSKPGDTYLIVNGVRKNNFKEIVYYGSQVTNGELEMEIVFGGDGSDKSIEAANVAGKGVIVINQGGIQAYSNIRKKVQDKKGKALFVVSTENISQFETLANQFQAYIGSGSLQLDRGKASDESIGVFFISNNLAADILKIKPKVWEKLSARVNSGGTDSNKLKPASLIYNVAMEEQSISSENVLGYLEGSDKKDEVIVITAHFDHIGKNGEQINNGADDDGSGTSAVMEIAQAFAMAKKAGHGPRRSLLFMTVTGEEKGLLGSEFYVQNPAIALSKTVANLNIDMIGRIDPSHESNPEYVYLVGSNKLSLELHELSEEVNKLKTGLMLDYTYNDENHPDRIYYRSDHWNFAKNNIPVIFYFNGTHEDYHKPTDTIEKIEFELLEKRTKLVYYTAWKLANRESRIKLK